ncbi:MAG: hypothetical protein ACTSRG_11285 [Candidatus Helarchaeota archaeon]
MLKVFKLKIFNAKAEYQTQSVKKHALKYQTFLKKTRCPHLFRYKGKVFAVGRFEPENDPIIYQRGSFFTRKRTSIFQVTEAGLIYLIDLPSNGDTSYAGVVVRDNENSVYISYYTSSIEHDIPWILGVISKSNIRMTKIDMNQLDNLADLKLAKNINNYKQLELPWLDYFAFSLIIATVFPIAYLWRKHCPFSKNKKRKSKKIVNLEKILLETYSK